MNHIGVDVDSQYLVCKARFGEEDLPVRQFDNNAVGHRQFIKWARHRGATARVCMEATGVYSLPFARALHSAEGIDVSVVNPKAIKRFADASMQRGKTDALDAERILEFLLRMAVRGSLGALEMVTTTLDRMADAAKQARLQSQA